MTAIRLEQVSKYFKNKEHQMVMAVEDIDLEIPQGDFIFFVGSRGAGKSTLLSLAVGDLRPERGAVFLNDTDMSSMTKRQRARFRYRVGKVPQESGLVRTVTVRRNLMAVKKGQSKPDAALVEKALGLVGMSDSEEYYPLELSISECRRIELAKAILHSPDILLLDEITARMDDDSIWDVMHLLDELNRRGTTVLMATNAKKFVNIMRKRVITLADGKIVGDVPRGRYGDIV